MVAGAGDGSLPGDARRSPAAGANAKAEQALLQPICAALSETPEHPRTAAQWAQTIGIDVRTLHRRFIRATTMSFAQWREQARLLTALKQLAGGAQVLDVALAAGDASATAFATMVKRQFGTSPIGFFD